MRALPAFLRSVASVRCLARARHAALLLFLPWLLPAPAQAQRAAAPRIAVGPNIRVTPGEHNEAWLAVSSTNPDVLLAMAQAGGVTTSARDISTLMSHDGGNLWTPISLPGYTHGAFDPMPVAGTNGRLYVMQGILGGSFASSIGSDARSTPTIRIWSTTDGWRWNGPTDLKATVQPDHPRMVVDMTAGPHRGRLYVAWNDVSDQFLRDQYEVFLQYSDDGGRTFNDPILIDQRHGGKLVATEPVVLSDGTLLVTYYQYWNPLADPRNDHLPFFVRRSPDGGATFEAPEKIFEFGPHVWREREGEFARSFSLPIVMADTSSASPHKDHVYIVYDDVHTGKSDISLVRSTDAGHTWSRPLRVNDNAPESPLGVVDYRMTPTVAVAHDGTLGITWYDRRNDPTRRCWEYFFAASVNGGATVGPNQPISSARSCPPPGQAPAVVIHNQSPNVDRNRAPDSVTARLGLIERLGSLAQDAIRAARDEADKGLPNGRLRVSFDPSRNIWPGHYSGLVADGNGVFHALWLDRRSGMQEMYTTRITVGAAALNRTGLQEGDITQLVEIIAGTPVYDAQKGTVRVPLQVRNVSNAPVFGPLTVRILPSTGSRATAPAILAGDSIASGIRFNGRLGTDDILLPLGLSEPVEITLRTAEATGLNASLDFRVSGSVRR